MENLIAIERGAWLGRTDRSNNFLIPVSTLRTYSVNVWVSYERLKFLDVVDKIKEAEKLGRYIAVSYHKADEKHDAYELYLKPESAVVFIKNESLFVFKFNVLSKEVTEEYKMYSL